MRKSRGISNNWMPNRKIILIFVNIFLTIVAVVLSMFVLCLLMSPCRSSVNPGNAVGGFSISDYKAWAIDNIGIAMVDYINILKGTRDNMIIMDDGRLHPLTLRITGEYLPDKNIICG
jgi:hypothetical protein